MTKVPMYTADLIKELDKLYPDVYQCDALSMEEYWKLAGKIELLRMLKSKGGQSKIKDVEV